jgi:ribonuclease PH
VQGTAEGLPFSREQMNGLLDLAEGGIRELLAAQKTVLGII